VRSGFDSKGLWISWFELFPIDTLFPKCTLLAFWIWMAPIAIQMIVFSSNIWNARCQQVFFTIQVERGGWQISPIDFSFDRILETFGSLFWIIICDCCERTRFIYVAVIRHTTCVNMTAKGNLYPVALGALRHHWRLTLSPVDGRKAAKVIEIGK
jgi:hypothetical protein